MIKTKIESNLKALVIPVILAFILMFRLYIGEDLRMNGQLYLFYGTMIAFALFVMVKANLWVGLFLFFALISAHYPIHTGQLGAYKTQLAQETFTMILAGVTLYVVCVQLLNTDKALKWSLNIVCVFVLMNIAFLFLQYLDHAHAFPWLRQAIIDSRVGFFKYLQRFFDRPFFTVFIQSQNADFLHNPDPKYPAMRHLIGLMSYPHGCSAVLAMCLAAFMRYTPAETPIKLMIKAFSWIFFLTVFVWALIVTHTFAGPMAIGFGLIVIGMIYFTWTGRIYLLCSVILVLGIYIIFVDRPDVSWRLNAWKIALFHFIPQKWAFGYGLGQSQVLFADKSVIESITNYPGHQVFGDWMQQLHNDPLQAFLEMGIWSPLIMTGYFVDIYQRYRNDAAIPLFAVCTVFASSMVAFPFHIGWSAAIGIFNMAWLEVKLCGKKQRTLFSLFHLFSLSSILAGVFRRRLRFTRSTA